MNLFILNTEIQEFINENLDADISKLAFKGSPFNQLSTKELIEQIEAKKRCKNKLTTWYKSSNIYYPNKLNIEQTSSEVTAIYKSNLISGNSVIDLTGGFGVDCFYLSKRFKKVAHCEINAKLSQVASHNFKKLNAINVNTITSDGIDYLLSLKENFDWIYIDPSRRHDSKGKVFFLKDCLPNVPEHLNNLFKYSENIMIKTSPLLDISVGISELNNVKEIHIVAVKNEVKELLWILEKNYLGDIVIKTINIAKENQLFNFNLSEENNATINYSEPLKYLYEPNSAIMKSGGFRIISEKLNLFKLNKHSHLYTSSEKVLNFPGRVFKVEKKLNYNKKTIKQESITKANIATRNFPESVQQLRKKFKIQDGGNLYLFFTTDLNNNKVIISTTKV